MEAPIENDRVADRDTIKCAKFNESTWLTMCCSKKSGEQEILFPVLRMRMTEVVPVGSQQTV